jgi:hypothetical protein
MSVMHACCRASVVLGLAAFMLLAQSALIPAHATDANECGCP